MRVIARKHVVIGASVALVIALAASMLTRVGEGLRLTPYRDIVGVLTVCYGETHGVQDRRYSVAECNGLLYGELRVADAAVRRCIPTPIPLPVEAAFADAVYVSGPRMVCGSTLQRFANARNWRGACDQLLRWNLAGGAYSAGVHNRRLREHALCVKGLADEN